jgi:hypothetical protein
MSPKCTLAAIAACLSLAAVTACGDGDSGASAAGMATDYIEAASGIQDGYALKLTVPRDVPSDPAANLMLMAVKTASVPSSSALNVPAYPGARIMSTMGASEMTVNGEKTMMWPSLAMLTNDEISKVAAFYQEKLSGWQHEEIIGNHMFWEGGPGTNPLDISGQFQAVGLVELGDTDTETKIWPGVKTRIDIRYKM